MPTLTRSIVPSISCLLLGMIFFALLGSIPVPPILISKEGFSLVACIAIFSLCFGFLRFEKLSLASFHLIPNKLSLIKLGYGLLIGSMIAGLMLISLFTLTDLGVELNSHQAKLPFLLGTLVIIPLALMEELLFRGYPFFRLSRQVNIRWVILATSVLFALYHYDGSQSITSLLLGPGVWGVTFAVAAYLSNSLAMPLGIHIAANYLQAIYGLKTQFPALWSITTLENTSSNNLPVESLGLSMQLILLISSVVLLEVVLWRRMSNR